MRARSFRVADRGALLAAAAVAALVVASLARGGGGPYITATPDAVRVAVALDRAVPLSSVHAPDASARDGHTTILVPGATGTTGVVRIAGVRGDFISTADGLRMELRTAPGRFKYLEYELRTKPERLVATLWKATPPPAAVRRGRAGCLTLGALWVTPGHATVAGREHGLFEHMFVVQLRGADGRVVARRSVAAAGGRWTASFPYEVTKAQTGTLEAADSSEADGSLVCLAEVRVRLAP